LNIKFTRDSVCPADDSNDTERDYFFDDIAWNEVIPFLKANGFIPNIPGNDVVWVLINDDNWEMLSYFTKFDETLIFKDILYNVTDFKHFHLEYYSSRLERGEKVFIDNDCNEYLLWHDGGRHEIHLCEVSEIEKEQWKKSYYLNRKLTNKDI